MIAAVALVALLQGGAAPVQAPMVTARVAPETPAIGEPITVELRVRAPAGADVRFPVLPDTGTRIEPLDPREIRDASTAEWVDRTAVYRLIAWDTGQVALAFGDIAIGRDGAEQRYPVALTALRIRSVLPADTAERLPRSARDPVEAASLRWRLWVALAVIAALAYWGWRRFRRHRAAAASAGLDPLGKARSALEHLRALELIAAGEPGRHLLAHVAVMRRYIADRWDSLGVHLTAQELEAALPTADFPILPQRVTTVALRAEAVAYARAAVTAEEAERAGVECAGIIDDLEQAWQARRDAAAAEDPSRIKRRKLR